MIEELRGSLERLVRRVRRRVPSSLCGVGCVGDFQPFASFAMSARDHSIDLCVLLKLQPDGAIACEADLVEGTGRVIGELPTLTVGSLDDSHEVQSLLLAVTAFIDSQEDSIVTELLNEK